MGKLVLFLKDATPVEIPLVKERVTIGRRPDNDVCLPYPAVSGEHAAVVTILADSFLEDLGSTNGTLVNGRPVAKHFLRDRDQVDIGRQLIVYLADDGARAEPPPAIAGRDERRELAGRVDGMADPGRAEPALASAIDADLGAVLKGAHGGHSLAEPRMPPDAREVAAAPGPAVGAADETFDAEIAAIRQARVDTATALPPEPPEAAPPPMPVRARLRVLTGPSAGRVVPVAGDEFVLGRVGVQVAAIVFRNGELVLVPREGPQPPTLNGEPVPADGCSVRTGDGLEVAGTRLELLAPE
ncbi:MAG: FHA domain-containing protein [Betaproteobacteria bacterium]|nr:FHA domain-containing protein [Betaproteobacteria bacterium]